jgi:hypothetical protein
MLNGMRGNNKNLNSPQYFVEHLLRIVDIVNFITSLYDTEL